MSGPGWLLRVLGGLPKPTKRPSPDDEPPRPLSRDRIGDYLLGRGYRFVVDEDGDLTGTWDGSRFWFLMLGEQEEILQVRGRWHRTFTLEQRAAVGLAVNDWNRERIWPKAYLREEDGAIALYSEVSADFEPGVTDLQLAQLVACGLGTGVQMFAALDGLLPRDETPPDDLPDN
ncbi:YbjN domain-containing protein [Cellulomonas biazotea]|uniref:YbjN domain-containing protein n=1 Tax=Cellulomonas biazotea TaxID=1709 RepID=A0A402DRY6_9CELL|nr:YbjN domain-containing protein [Cellulomonas biazotea]GCE76855.1 hypothetical protein CBZ_19110 [Cellulomonas biazotea]